VIDGGDEGTILRIEAPGVEVHGLTLRRSGASYTAEDAGIRIEKAADVRVTQSRIEDTLFGIFIVQGDRCVIERSTVIGKDLPHVRRGDGIRLWYSSGCRLAQNHVERSRDVIIWYSSGTVVEENMVRASRYGLHYMYRTTTSSIATASRTTRWVPRSCTATASTHGELRSRSRGAPRPTGSS
jgi:nitrous oxidase accessory protein